MVALVHPGAQRLGRLELQPDLCGSRFEQAALLEAGVGEDSQHPDVVRHDFSDELVDPDARREWREPFEQTGRDPAALELVGDRKGDLGRAGSAEPHVTRQRDDLVVLRSDERAALDPVGLEHRLDETLVNGRMSVEAKVEAAVGERLEEIEERDCVTLQRRAKPHGRAVPKDDVRHHRRCHIHQRRGCHSRAGSARGSVSASARCRTASAGCPQRGPWCAPMPRPPAMTMLEELRQGRLPWALGTPNES